MNDWINQGVKGQIFLNEEFQIINVERMEEIENCQEHTRVIIAVGKIHWQMIKLMSRTLRRKRRFT